MWLQCVCSRFIGGAPTATVDKKKWHHMECLIVRHAGDMSLSLLRSVARVRLEWQFEMDSWVTMLEAPNAQAVLATILQEICNGVWSVRTTSKAC